MASPLCETAQHLVNSFFQAEKEEAGGNDHRRRMSVATRGIADMVKESQANQHEVEASFVRTRSSQHETEAAPSGKVEALVEQAAEMNVEGWEFNSTHAIAAEYVERHADRVSAL